MPVPLCTPDWTDVLTAATAAFSSVALAITLFFMYGQVQEARLAREAVILKEVYDLIRQSRHARHEIYENAELIGSVKTVQELGAFRQSHRDLHNAILEASNCYQYIGFLVVNGILTDKTRIAFLEEAAHTLLGVYRHVKTYIELERKLPGNEKYKQHLLDLVEEAEIHLDQPGYRRPHTRRRALRQQGEHA